MSRKANKLKSMERDGGEEGPLRIKCFKAGGALGNVF